MIILPASAIWIWFGLSLAVAVCAFIAGWISRAYPEAERAAAARASERAAERRPPPPARQLPRPGLLAPPVYPNDPSPVDIQRWWPALERDTGPRTVPFTHAHVETSNWERNLQRRQDAWMHERGMRDGQ